MKTLTLDEFEEALAFTSHTLGFVEDEGRRIRLNLSNGRVILISADSRCLDPPVAFPLLIEEEA